MKLRSNPRHDTRWRLRPTHVGCLLGCLLGAQLLGAQGVARESDVEAAYLFNFGKFMRVAGNHRPDFRICILGADPFGSTLDQLTAQESIDGRSMRIARILSPEDAKSCDILFLAESDPSRIVRKLEPLGETPVLTVSTASGFLASGGMIQFVVQQNRVRFEVNLDAVSRAHIQLSSDLLKVALAVSGAPAAGKERP